MSEIETALAKAMMKSILEDTEESEIRRPVEIEARRMLDYYHDFSESHEFKAGDLVTWKRGLKNGRFPYQDYPAVVSKKYDEPVVREDMESGSNHFRESLDMIIIVDTGDEVSEFHVDSRRFKPYTGDIVSNGEEQTIN